MFALLIPAQEELVPIGAVFDSLLVHHPKRFPVLEYLLASGLCLHRDNSIVASRALEVVLLDDSVVFEDLLDSLWSVEWHQSIRGSAGIAARKTIKDQLRKHTTVGTYV